MKAMNRRDALKLLAAAPLLAIAEPCDEPARYIILQCPTDAGKTTSHYWSPDLFDHLHQDSWGETPKWTITSKNSKPPLT